MIKYSIGIDISKSDFHAGLSTIDLAQHVKAIRSGKFPNTKAGFAEFVKWVKSSCSLNGLPVSIVMEVTGGTMRTVRCSCSCMDIAYLWCCPTSQRNT